MPYYVYKVFSQHQVEYVEDHAGYRDARESARDMRKALPTEADHRVKIIFAKNAGEAERLLTEEREPMPMGDD